MKKLLNNIASNLGKKEYQLDERIDTLALLSFMRKKSTMLLRGFFLKFRLKSSKGLVFLGGRTRVQYARRISSGKTLTIGSNVTINALCKNGVEIGNNVSILDNTIIECTGVLRNIGEGLIIGNNVGFAQNCFIQVRGAVNIGNNVIFGPYSKVFSENHNFSDLNIPIRDQGEIRESVKIEDNVWIGANATILSGVTVGEGSVIAASSLVNKDVPPFSVVAGVPAKIIRKRNK